MWRTGAPSQLVYWGFPAQERASSETCLGQTAFHLYQPSLNCIPTTMKNDWFLNWSSLRTVKWRRIDSVHWGPSWSSACYFWNPCQLGKPWKDKLLSRLTKWMKIWRSMSLNRYVLCQFTNTYGILLLNSLTPLRASQYWSCEPPALAKKNLSQSSWKMILVLATQWRWFP